MMWLCAIRGAQPFEASAVQPNMAMPHQTSSSTIETDGLEGLSRELHRWLTGVRATLADEIRSYPTPIPRCDAQFNHLVEQRGRLSWLLTDLAAALDRRVATLHCEPSWRGCRICRRRATRSRSAACAIASAPNWPDVDDGNRSISARRRLHLPRDSLPDDQRAAVRALLPLPLVPA